MLGVPLAHVTESVHFSWVKDPGCLDFCDDLITKKLVHALVGVERFIALLNESFNARGDPWLIIWGVF